MNKIRALVPKSRNFFQFSKKSLLGETYQPPSPPPNPFASCPPVICVYKTNLFLEIVLQCSNLLNHGKLIRVATKKTEINPNTFTKLSQIYFVFCRIFTKIFEKAVVWVSCIQPEELLWVTSLKNTHRASEHTLKKLKPFFKKPCFPL